MKCALDGCDEPPRSPAARYCSVSHKKRADYHRKRERLRIERLADPHAPLCPVCGRKAVGCGRTYCEPACQSWWAEFSNTMLLVEKRRRRLAEAEERLARLKAEMTERQRHAKRQRSTA